MKPLILPNGMDYSTGDNGERICRGAMMGRPSWVPEDRHAPCKLRMVKLRWVDSDYDPGGAYWGNGNGSSVYWATNRAGVDDSYHADGSGQLVELFVRAISREIARRKVRELLPHARFYR